MKFIVFVNPDDFARDRPDEDRISIMTCDVKAEKEIEARISKTEKYKLQCMVEEYELIELKANGTALIQIKN